MPDTDTPQASPEPGEASPPAADSDGSPSTGDTIHYTRITFDVAESDVDQFLIDVSEDLPQDVLLVEADGPPQWSVADNPEAKLTAALATAQAAFPPINKTKTATVEKNGTTVYSYTYADLGDVLAAVRPVLARNGLALMQRTHHQEDGKVLLTTALRHVGGGVETSEVELGQSPGNPQQFGGALTYLRRYEAVTLLGIAAEEDRDAQDVEPVRNGNGNGRAPQLPGWAVEASDRRVQEGLKALSQVVGRDRAVGVFRGMKDSYSVVPDIAVAMAKVVATAHAGATATPQEKAEARAPRAEAEQADRAAEAPDAVPDAEVVEEPPPGTGELPADAAERPSPGSVKAPNLKGVKDDDEIRERYREAGCICEDPLTGADDGDDQCPIIQHGIPF